MCVREEIEHIVELGVLREEQAAHGSGQHVVHHGPQSATQVGSLGRDKASHIGPGMPCLPGMCLGKNIGSFRRGDCLLIPVTCWLSCVAEHDPSILRDP